ncbi:YbhB/YbcL family Raf kinase inhibitor-like protein [Aquincola sp. MAHUQ-54]|uniref:YbhB/YbcL family Raf kinase inhibitor-like protein n=1 Tax=Aquincola agrisoli TaxID=3119538 RepID=A0AAW9QHA3_9BURK
MHLHAPWPRRVRAATLLAAAALAAPAIAQQGDGTDVAVQAHVYKPDKVPPTAEHLARLRVPAGFTVNVFASGLKNVRMLAVAPDGRVYASRRDQGDVLMLQDADRDGRADGAPLQVASRAGAHGLAIHGGRLYLATVKEVFAAPIRPDGTLGTMEMLMGDLPDSGQHPNRTLAFGPDGMLYISVGSTCNACNESNPENAALLRAAPDGSSRTIFASGLRNTIGFDWHPVTGELWGMDHGIDHLGGDVQPEELNRIERGRQYGWPHIWGDGAENPQSTPVGDIGKAQWRALSTPMVMGYTAHAAPMQMLFYRGGSFPAEYTGDAFVTMRGSWNRKPASGYEIVRVRYAQGRPAGFEPFATGFLTDGGRTHIARPVGLAVAADGALLMADDANGVIYRIAAAGGGANAAAAPGAAAPASAPPAAMLAQAARGNGVPLALQREEVRAAPQTLRLASPAFGPDGTIPPRHSEYADGVSPALQWKPVAGARSYVLVMEDPDARPVTPFVHWVAWNIPGTATSLPEGLQEQIRLTEPDGLLQGRTSRGSPGYYGPRPPAGDPPHRYHFQLFALDAVLDVPPGADRDQVLAAMRGHVLARGELVGRFAQAVRPPK